MRGAVLAAPRVVAVEVTACVTVGSAPLPDRDARDTFAPLRMTTSQGSSVKDGIASARSAALPPDVLARAVASAVTEGVVVHDGQRVVQVTATLARMFGYSPDEMVGLPSTDLCVPEDRARLRAHMAAQSDAPLEGTALRRDGSTFPVEVVGRTVETDGRTLRVVLARDLTERRERERARAEQDARYRVVVHQLPAVVWTTDRDLRITMIDGLLAESNVPATDPRIGERVEVILGAHEDPEAGLAAHERALAGEASAYVVRARSGIFEVSLEPLRDPDGTVQGVIGVAVDISGEVQAWETARRSQDRFNEIVSRIPELFWVAELEPELRISFMSPSFERIFQMPVGRMYEDPRAYLERVHPDDLARVAGTLREREIGRDLTVEYRIVLDDGRVRWIRHRRYPVPDESGVVRRLVGITEDVTERRARAQELRESRRALAAVTDNSPDVFTRFDRDGRIRFISRAVEAETGIPASRFIGHTMHDMGMPEELCRRWDAALRAVFDTGRPAELSWAFTRPDGELRSYHARIAPERDEAGAVETVLTVTHDVTESVRAHEAMRESEARFRGLVEHAADLVSILNEDATLAYASPSHRAVLGYAPDELLARPIMHLIHPDDVERAQRMIETAMRVPGPTAPEVIRVLGANGEYRSLEALVTDMRDDPAVRGIVANSRDISPQIALEERLRRAQRLEAVGQLAGGVAHDFNNILATVSGYAEALVQELPPDDPRHADAIEISHAASRGASIAKQLLAFARPQAIETEVIDLAAAVRATGRMLRPLLPASIALEMPAEDTAPIWVRASRAQIEQIVVNLAVNARDAMPDGGELRFTVEQTVDDAGHGAALLRVSDAGIGIPADVRDRIFDPFFTTKPAGQGTGLGLSTVYGLVRQFGGSISLHSQPGVGTTFSILLPLSAAGDQGGSATPPEPAQGGAMQTGRRGGRILLVEDEAQLRSVTERILKRNGYDVVSAANGREALDALQREQAFELVLTDAAMPVMGGAELAREVAARYPGLPVLLMSGYAELGASAAAGGAVQLPEGVTAFLEKPYRVDHFLEVVERTMRGVN